VETFANLLAKSVTQRSAHRATIFQNLYQQTHRKTAISVLESVTVADAAGVTNSLKIATFAGFAP
jgi:hypothetical protein